MQKIHQKIVNKHNLVFVLIFLFFGNTYSQKIENINTNDTIYIVFKNKSIFEKKYKPYSSKSKFIDGIINYSFTKDFYNTIIFVSNKYKDYDSMDKGIENDIKTVKKSFLKDNKDKILDVNFFLKNGFKQTFFSIYGKVIYLIDKDEIKNGKMILKQVEMINHTYIEE